MYYKYIIYFIFVNFYLSNKCYAFKCVFKWLYSKQHGIVRLFPTYSNYVITKALRSLG